VAVHIGVARLGDTKAASSSEPPAAEQRGRELTGERRRTLEKLLAELRPQLFRYAYWLCRDPGLADDVVQEALIRAWKSLPGLKDDRAIKQWLLTIVRREHARVYERKRLDSTDIDELGGADQFLIATTDDTDVAEMRQAILGLEADYREPLVLQVLMGHTAEEIGQIMGLNTGAVLTRLFRARKKLAATLGSDTR
jgi:RNA polymerase sigma-70 factor, ECF subfamily